MRTDLNSFANPVLKLIRLAAFALPGLLVPWAAEAQVRQFPYEAVVMSQNVDVWSGPGTKYYATGKLSANETVTVHRHDPGGWFMIAPPAGSFSWIKADYVDSAGNGKGIVNVPPDADGRPARAIVRIGSTLSDEHSYYGRELSTGDEVQILGEKTLNTDRGPARMVKIAPPPLEYRWVKGDYIVPRDEAARQQLSRDPYAVPAAVVAQQKLLPNDPFSPQSNKQTGTGSTQGSSPTATETPAQRMQQIDGRYTVMMRQTPENWDVDALVAEYSDLLPSAPPEVANEILQRLNALETRRSIQSDYVALTGHSVSEQGLDASPLGSHVPPGSVVAPSTTAPPVQPGNAAGLGLQTQPSPAPQVPTQPGADSNGPSQAIAARLNGAGIVRVTPQQPRVGLPAFSLVAPDGRFLAYLHPGAGVNLQQSVGQSIGVIGQREYDARVQADVIIVRQVVPVQLTH